MPSKRHFRQREGGTSEATFAAAPIDLTRPDDLRYATTLIQRSKAQSRTAWDWYKKLGEIHYGVSRSAKVGGFAELGVYKMGKNGEIGEQVTTGLPGEIAQSLYSPYGGQRGFIERFLTLMKIPGDSYLIQAVNEGVPDGYDFVSADELKVDDPTILTAGKSISRITLPGTQNMIGNGQGFEDKISPANFVGRVWRPSAQFVDIPDSPMESLDGLCEMLHLLTAAIRAKLLSRLAMNGIFFVPNEVNNARSTAPKGEPGEWSNNDVLNTLIQTAVYAARNPTDAAASLPVFMTGPGQHAEQFRHIVMDQELYATDMQMRSEIIDRILVGLDTQPSQVKGSQDSNHWSAWSASEDELRVAVRPDLETMCWALTRLVLWGRLQEANFKRDITQYVVWFDLSRAQSHQNLAEDARQLQDRIDISPRAAREASGFEERHAPTDIEYIRMVGVKCSDPYLATFGMPDAEKFDWDKIGSTKTGPGKEGEGDGKAGPGTGSPGSPADNKSKTPARLRPA